MLPERINIADRLSYWKARSSPLSSDIGIFEGREYTWVFDAGNGDIAAECLKSLPKPRRVVLSHFHQDHIGSLNEAEFDSLYQGAYTFKHTGMGDIVRDSMTFEDGALIRLFEIPSSHAKGCIGMEINETYAFLGDSTYCTAKNPQGRYAYNATLLFDELRVLKSLRAEYFLLSHDETFIRKKDDVVAELEEIYGRREPKCPYIFID